MLYVNYLEHLKQCQRLNRCSNFFFCFGPDNYSFQIAKRRYKKEDFAPKSYFSCSLNCEKILFYFHFKNKKIFKEKMKSGKFMKGVNQFYSKHFGKNCKRKSIHHFIVFIYKLSNYRIYLIQF